MILKITSKFKKDYERCKKRGLDLSLLQEVIRMLEKDIVLDAKYRDHALTGQYKGFRECHIQPDWLLIYSKDEKMLILTAVRTGTHSDLLKL